jgi:hypothetical protein
MLLNAVIKAKSPHQSLAVQKTIPKRNVPRRSLRKTAHQNITVLVDQMLWLQAKFRYHVLHFEHGAYGRPNVSNKT